MLICKSSQRRNERFKIGTLAGEVNYTPGHTPVCVSNVHVHAGVSEDEFVAMRNARGAKLVAPLLLLPSILVNIRARRFPPDDVNGVHDLEVPVKLAS